MAQAATPRLIRTAPEPFTGKGKHALPFWNSLENYYHTNNDAFADDNKKVAAALTHFKVGTQARNWASDRMATALSANPVTYGTWAQFKTDFKDQFIPPETQAEAIKQVHSLIMGNRDFNKWYQEWSQFARRSCMDDQSKMFTFRKNLKPEIHNKLILVSPQPTTLAGLVEKAREIDNNWRTFGNPGGQGRRLSNFHRSNNPKVWEVINEDAEVNATRVRTTPPKHHGRLTPGERQHRIDNNLCLYCGKPGHKAIECTAPPNKRPGTKLRQVETTERDEEPDDPLDDQSVNIVGVEETPLPFGFEDSMAAPTPMDTSF